MRRRKVGLLALLLLAMGTPLLLTEYLHAKRCSGTLSRPVNAATWSPERKGVVLNLTLSALPEDILTTEMKAATRPRPVQVNAFDFPLSIRPARVCAGTPPFLLIIVPSVHSHAATRTAIRSTWGSYAKNSSGLGQDVKLVFMFGTCRDKACREQLEKEAAMFDDVLQGDFLDSYRTLPIKMVAGLRWVTEACRGVGFVLKADEDTFVNIPALIRVLSGLKWKQVILGRIIGGNPVMREGKFKVLKEDFFPDTYPRYAAGHTYVISGEMVPQMFNNSHYLRLMSMEDVYITGLLPRTLGVTYVSSGAFAYWDKANHDPCDFILNRRLTATNIADFWKIHIWTLMHKENAHC